MKHKRAVVLTVLLLLLFCLFCSAGCKSNKTLSCRLTEGDKVVLEKIYPLSFVQSLRLKKYKTLLSWQEKSGLSEMDFLRSLNPELADDIASLSERNEEKTEAEITYLGDGKFLLSEGKPGRAVSLQKIATDFIAAGGVFSGEIPYKNVLPVHTKNDLLSHTEKIFSFSTDYSSSSPERKHNIALAAEKLDNLTVEARTTLSFNETVGKRTEQNGYKEAGVIAFGKFTRGIGGGVCQVSTTLYNAWIRAGFDATGNNHSLTVSYVQPGTDAMVSDSSDLVLYNQSDYPVFLDANCDGKKLSFTLYGTKPKEKIRLWSEKIKDYPCEEYEIIPGDEDKVLSLPKSGSLYRSFRDYYVGETLVRRERLRISEYKAVKGKKIVSQKEKTE